MVISWDQTFSQWAQAPAATEQQRSENSESAIRNAVAASEKLKNRKIRVFPQGSYRNRVNVRRDSDVDIGVCCFDVFFPSYPDGTTRETFGNIAGEYEFSVFKNEVEDALVSYFTASSVHRGNKAFDLTENTYRVEADVAPFFEHRRYHADGSFLTGVELRPDSAQLVSVINWPDQHYANGVSKNTASGRRFKAVVRILKSLCNQMESEGISAASDLPGFLIECLVYNVPNSQLGNSTYSDDVRSSIVHLYSGTADDQACADWVEVSDLKYLFRGNKPWTRQQANKFMLAAWQYLGFK